MGVITGLAATWATSVIAPDFKQFLVRNFLDGTGEMFLFFGITLVAWDVGINTENDGFGIVDYAGSIVAAAAMKVVADGVRA